MALDLDNMRKNMDDFFNSEEGKASIKKFWEDKERERKLYAKQVKRFYKNNKDNMPAVIEKILAKYDSKEYVRREYKLGYQPREPLTWILRSIAAKYGKKVTRRNAKQYEEYINMFTSEAYIYEGYFIQVMNGQGSVVRINKIKKEI